MIKLIALDLDGTLLNPDSKLSDVDRDAVLAAKERGVHVVLSTARWHGIAARTAHRLDLATPLICHNGAHVAEPNGGAELLHLTIPQEVGREIVSLCDEGAYETYTTVSGVTYMRSRFEKAIDPARLPEDMFIEHDQAARVTGPVTGIVVFGDEAVGRIVETFGKRYVGVVELPVAKGGATPSYVTITGAGCNKGTALRLVCEHFGVGLDEVLAAGDAQPDVDMFDIVRVGVAMGNAPDDVKAQADAVAPSNAEGGIAWALRRYVLEEN